MASSPEHPTSHFLLSRISSDLARLLNKGNRPSDSVSSAGPNAISHDIPRPSDAFTYLASSLTTNLTQASRSNPVQKIIGATQGGCVPSVLTEGATPLSFSTFYPLFFTRLAQREAIPIQAADRYWTGNFPGNQSDIDSYLAGFNSQDYVFYPTGELKALPFAASAEAYSKMLKAVMSQTYTTTPRLFGFSALSLPTDLKLASDNYPDGVTGPSQNTIPLGSNVASALGDCISFDPQIAYRNAVTNQYAHAGYWYGSQQAEGQISDSVFAVGLNLPQPGFFQNYGVAQNPTIDFGYANFGAETDMIGQSISAMQVYNLTPPSGFSMSPLVAPLAEFFRQLLCSPLLYLEGSTSNPAPPPRPTVYPNSAPYTPGEALTGATASIPSGQGFVNFCVTGSSVVDGKPQQWLPIGFRVNFSLAPGSTSVKMIVPRGKVIAGIFHPGFSIPTYQLDPIRAGDGVAMSCRIAIQCGGCATAMKWSIGLANPSNPFVRLLSE